MNLEVETLQCLVAKRKIPRIEQAGAIVVRPGRDEPRILLVTARRNPNNWILPKGHIEDGETRKDAALREAREEAGINGQVVGPAGSMVFDFGYNHYRVHYFVITTTAPVRNAKAGACAGAASNRQCAD